MHRRTSTSAGLLLTVYLCLSPTLADVFQLKSGGEIVGQLRGETDTHYLVRTFVGQIEIEKADVTQHTPGHSIFDEYDRRLAKLERSADALVNLANWCGKNGLSQERRQHLDQALKLNPNHALARAALGYTRVGEMWIESETTLETKARRKRAALQAEREKQREHKAKLDRLTQELKQIDNQYFSGFARERAIGTQKLEAFAQHDPDALGVMFEFLKKRPRSIVRSRLLRIFAHAKDPDATRYIAYSALKDPSRSIRQQATSVLFKRDVDEVVCILAAALEIKSDITKARAAKLITELNGQSAVPALIDNLVGQREKWVTTADGVYTNPGIQLDNAANRSGNYRGSLFSSSQLQVSSTCKPCVRYWGPPMRTYSTTQRLEDVPVYRTAIRDALRDLTGEDYGFDKEAWSAWLDKHPHETLLQQGRSSS